MDSKKISYVALGLAAVVAVGGINGVNNSENGIFVSQNTENARTFAGTAEKESQQQKGVISGTIYEEISGKNFNPATDKKIAGANVSIFDENGKKLLTTKSNDQGFYSFNGVTIGNYTISAVLQNNNTNLKPLQENNTQKANITNSNNKITLNFGFVQ